MIKKFEISGIHAEVDKKLHNYATKKIGKLDKYLPRRARESAHAEVKLKESKKTNQNHCTCEVILFLPHEVITVKESTINMFAAVDIVEEKLKNRIKSYKEKHLVGRFKRRIISHLKRDV